MASVEFHVYEDAQSAPNEGDYIIAVRDKAFKFDGNYLSPFACVGDVIHVDKTFFVVQYYNEEADYDMDEIFPIGSLWRKVESDN